MAVRRQVRWPANAEDQRTKTIREAEERRRQLAQARQEPDPMRKDIAIADAITGFADIQRWMTEARLGRDGERA